MRDLKVFGFRNTCNKSQGEFKTSHPLLLPLTMNELTDNREDNDDEVKHIPAEFEVVEPHGNQTNDCLDNEDPSEDIVQIS